MDPKELTSIDEYVNSLSKSDARQQLRTWREEHGRNAELVRAIWLSPKLKLRTSVGDERFQILEQVCLAALDLNDRNLIKECLTELMESFPSSVRVRRLRMMASFELNERYDDALQEYKIHIDLDPTNAALYKRRISVYIAARQPQEAIKLLCDYLKKFANDTEAWILLSNLYIELHDYPKASFCMEELILSNPHNHVYYERFAEIQYTIGSLEALELARSYFAQAIRLRPTSLRSLYGLILACNALSQHPRVSSQKKKDCPKLAQWAAKQISTVYADAKATDDVLHSVESALSNFNISN